MGAEQRATDHEQPRSHRTVRRAPRSRSQRGKSPRRCVRDPGGLGVTAFGPGRWCDEHNLVDSAALGCIKGPSGQAKRKSRIRGEWCVGEFIALVSFAVFVWAVVGLINPKAARLPNRITSVWIWLLSVALAVMGGSVALAGMGGSLMPDDPAEPASEEAAASAPASPTPPPPPRDSAPGAADGAPRQQRYRCAVRLSRVWQPNCGSAERRSFSELVLAAVRVLTSGLDRPVVVGVRRQVQRWRCHGRGQQLEHRLERTGSEVCCFVPCVVGILVPGPDRPAVLRVR